MTNDNTNYQPSGVPLYGSAIAVSKQDTFEPETWTDITTRCTLSGMKLHKGVRILELRVTDLRTGWGQQDDRIKASSCSAMNCYRRHLTLPPFVTQTALGTAMNQGAMFYAHIQSGPGTATTGQVGLNGQDNALVMAGGNAGSDTYSLFTETTSISPVPLQTSNPGSGVVVSISALTSSPTGIAGQAIIGMSGSVAAQIVGGVGAQGSGSYATGAMNAATANTWGVLPTNLNSSAPNTGGGHLIYAGTTLSFLANTAAYSDAPVVVQSGIPGGGKDVGVDVLQKNYLNRAHWLWPKVNSTTSVFSSDKLIPPNLDWHTTNLEGTQDEILPTTLTRIRGGVLWNHQAIRWDGVRVTRFDGETETDMRVLEGRELNSDFRWGISNVTTYGSELYVWTVRMDMTVAAGVIGLSELHCEKYLGDGLFVNYGPVISAANSNAGSVSTSVNRETINGAIDLMHQASCGIPISRQTGFAHLNMYNSTKWDRMWFPPEGVNPFLYLNKTGASDEISQKWATSGSFLSNKFPIPPQTYNSFPAIHSYHGLPAVAVGCSAAEMNIAAGGAGASVQMLWYQQDGTTHTATGAMTETFSSTDPLDRQTRFWLDNNSMFTLGQFQIVINQGSDVNKTPNALPGSFYVMVNMDGVLRTPREAGFVAEEGWLP